jgi:UDP-N-acetylglucosamine--N-acetylmuramyl-(pentapeptide) pyrophosphoryl-undecaprenol N-acetylglucosamine transferase
LKQRVIFAGGGTAGHIEPALAVADSLRKLAPEIECQFIGTNSGLEKTLVPKRNYQLRVIPKVALPRRISMALLKFPFQFIGAVIAASRICKGASALVGFGGYVSAASYIAAKMNRVPIIIHEANAKPGWANKLGRKLATATAVNFFSISKSWPNSFLTGMPIKREIAALSDLDYDKRLELRSKHLRELRLKPEIPVIAVFGGSQGSKSINTAIADFLTSEKSKQVQIIHALGPLNDLPKGTENYRPMAYFEDMANIYLIANLLVTRSGAVTCAEIQCTNSRAILVPLPHGNGEQMINAKELEGQGFAKIVDETEFSGQWLNENLLNSITTLNEKRIENSKLHVQASEKIAKLILDNMKDAN